MNGARDIIYCCVWAIKTLKLEKYNKKETHTHIYINNFKTGKKNWVKKVDEIDTYFACNNGGIFPFAAWRWLNEGQKFEGDGLRGSKMEEPSYIERKEEKQNYFGERKFEKWDEMSSSSWAFIGKYAHEMCLVNNLSVIFNWDFFFWGFFFLFFSFSDFFFRFPWFFSFLFFFWLINYENVQKEKNPKKKTKVCILSSS